MSLNPSSSFLSAFPFALLRFLLDYLDCVIVLKLWYNFYFPFAFLLAPLLPPSLLVVPYHVPLALSGLRRFSLNCFRCLRYLAPLFRLVIHLFLFCSPSPRFFCVSLLFFFSFLLPTLMSVKTIFASCFVAV